MVAITRQEALTTYTMSFPNIRLSRIVLSAEETSDVKTGSDSHVEENNVKAGLMKDPIGDTCSAEIIFALHKKAGAAMVRSTAIPQISATEAAMVKIKFAVLGTTGPADVFFKETGEPVFTNQGSGEAALSEKIFPLSDFNQTEYRAGAKNAVVTETSIIRTASLTLRGLPSNESNLTLFCMIYTNKDDMAEYGSPRINSAWLPQMNSPSTRQVLLRGGEPPVILERFFYPTGEEFVGYPYKEQNSGGNTTYSFSFENFNNPANVLVRRNVTNNLIQDFRDVTYIDQPISFDFTSMHNLIDNLGIVTKDLGQRLNFFENPAVFSTLQTSFDEVGMVSGVFSVDFLKALRGETLFPTILQNKNDEIKKKFVNEALSQSGIQSMTITREKVMSLAEQSELGQGTSLLTADIDDELHVVVTTSEGGSGTRYKQLEYAGGTTSAPVQTLCGRVEEASLGGFGLRHFMFKDYDITSDASGHYQYSCHMYINNGLRRVLAGKKIELNTHRLVLNKVYEIACNGSLAKGTGHYNANVKRFRRSFSQKLVSLYGLTYEQLVGKAVAFYVNLLFALIDERDRKILDDPNSQTSNISSLTPGRLQTVLLGISTSLEGLEILIKIVDELSTAIHSVIGTSDNNNLSRQDYSRVGGAGGTSSRSILEIENRFDELVYIQPQLASKYDFIFESRGTQNTIIRSMNIMAFENRWAAQQKKYFKEGAVEQNQSISVPLSSAQTPEMSVNIMDSMIYLSPIRVAGNEVKDEVVVAGGIGSFEVGPGAHKAAFLKLLYESATGEPDAARVIQEVGNAGATINSIMLNETLGAVNNVTIAGRENDLVSFTGESTASTQEVLGNAISLSVTQGVQNFENLINYLTMNSILESFRDDLRVYNVRPSSGASLVAVNLSRAGYSLFSENFAKSISEGASISSLLNEMPSSVMSLVLAATPPVSQPIGSGISIATETSPVSSLSGVSSLNHVDVLPYFIMNYKILACLEVFRGFEEKVYTDEETMSESKEYCMGEPRFVKTNLSELRQYVQDSGKVLCRVRRYYRNFFNVRENEYFDFPIANSLFVISSGGRNTAARGSAPALVAGMAAPTTAASLAGTGTSMTTTTTGY